MKSNRKLIVIIGIMVVLLALTMLPKLIKNDTSEANNSINEPQVSIRYAAPLTIAAAPVYVADAKGFWKNEGIDVGVTYFDSGRKALDALLSDDAEVMSVSETPPLRAFLAGSNINIVSTVTRHKEAKMTIRSDRVSEPQDIKGKKIGTVAGTNSDYYMYRWLEDHDIKSTDVSIIQLDAAALSQAFVQGNIDAMFAWEPHNYNAASKIPNLSKSWPTEIYNGRHTVVMNSDYARAHPETVDRLNKGFLRAEVYIKDNPDAAKKIVMERTGMSASALNALWDEYNYAVGLDDGFLDIIKDEASWIKSSEGNSSQADVLKLTNPASLLRVDTNKVGKAFKP